MPSYFEIAYNGAMVVLMGLLIGLEREHSQREEESLFAGVRTFPLITLTGFLSALVAKAGFDWVLPVALAGVCAVAVAAYVMTARGPHKGATTEFVAILAFIFGALTALGYLIPAATFAVVTTLVLSMKAPLHQLAERIQKDEIFAILKFGIVTVIVLPLLPNRSFGPFEVLNPRLIWWLVVLISAVSMVGYVLMRFWGARRGIAVTGFLGGLASSTATTFGLSQKAREAEPSAARYFALGIVIASTIMFFRVLFLTFVIDPALGWALAIPIAVPTALCLGIGLFLWRKKEAETEIRLQVKNPMELGRAIQFGLLFGIVLFVAKASHSYFGSAGIYVTSALAGLTDVDAITVSAARLSHDGVLATPIASASILLACAANTLVKGGIAVVVGGRGLRGVIGPAFLAVFVASLAATLVVALASG
jgi:uncharacterized membrane protein (DUF4010 family)